MTDHNHLCIVTATTDLARARPCIESWTKHAQSTLLLVIICNSGEKPDGVQIRGADVAWSWTPDYLGTVPAFRKGVDVAIEIGSKAIGQGYSIPVIACLHDDLEIHEYGWDLKVLQTFDRFPQRGLIGFGGALALGDDDLYQKAYAPMQLARQHFRSNLVDAEVHGVRSLLPERVACLDGFSQVGRREFWQGFTFKQSRLIPKLDQIARELAAEHPQGFVGEGAEALPTSTSMTNRPWHVLADLGLVHHFYDGALGALAARYGWEVWYLPIRGKHLGGQTAVGDRGYQEWAKQQVEGGDRGFWERAHQISYEAFKDVLPLRIG